MFGHLIVPAALGGVSPLTPVSDRLACGELPPSPPRNSLPDEIQDKLEMRSLALTVCHSNTMSSTNESIDFDNTGFRKTGSDLDSRASMETRLLRKLDLRMFFLVIIYIITIVRGFSLKCPSLASNSGLFFRLIARIHRRLYIDQKFTG